MPNERCNHGNSAPADVLANLPESQAGLGHHKCAICAYHEGFDADVENERRGTPDEIHRMIDFLKSKLHYYVITVETHSHVRFQCAKENFEAAFPIYPLLAMFRAGQIEEMFLVPGTVPF